MISNVYSSSPYLVTYSNQGASPYINTNQPMTGMLRFYSGQMQVYDGANWQNIGGGTANIDLSPDATRILEWAKKKMQEDEELAEMAKQYPALEKAKANLDLIYNIVKDDHERSKNSV